MDFHQAVHAKLTGQHQVVSDLDSIEDRRNKKDGIGSIGMSLVDLGLVDDKILPQDRQVNLLPDCRDIGQVTLEEINIGKDRDGPGATLFIIDSYGYRIELLTDNTFGR